MILIKQTLYCFFLFIFTFLFFDVKNVNTIDAVALIHENNDEDVERYYDINFYDLDVLDVDKIFKDLDILILSVKPLNYEKIYYKNTYLLIKDYNNLYIKNDLPVATLKSFRIESMTILCTKSELIKLENRVEII